MSLKAGRPTGRTAERVEHLKAKCCVSQITLGLADATLW
jgi:hypothetical protein